MTAPARPDRVHGAAAAVFRADENAAIDHAAGIRTHALVVPRSGAGLPCGVSTYAPRVVAPVHRHNCNEQILVLEGRAELTVGGRSWLLGPQDCGWIPAGVDHTYRNIGNGDLRLLWFYDAVEVTRTGASDGVTQPLLGTPARS